MTPPNRPGPMPRHLARRAIALAGLALLWALPARAQFWVEPVILPFAAPAEGDVRLVQVINGGTQEMQFRIYAGDFDQDEAGEHELFAAGGHPRSCAAQLRFFPNGVTLRPGEQQAIQVRMGPVERTCWSLLFIESSAPTASGIRANQRIGVKVYGIPAAAETDAEVTSVSVAGEAGGLAVTLDFQSAGEAPLRPRGRVEIRSFTGEVVAVREIEPFSVLPGYRRRATVRIDEPLPPGQYVAVPILDFDGDYLAGGHAVFEIR